MSSRVDIVARDLKALQQDFSQDRTLRNDSIWILRSAQNDDDGSYGVHKDEISINRKRIMGKRILKMYSSLRSEGRCVYSEGQCIYSEGRAVRKEIVCLFTL